MNEHIGEYREAPAPSHVSRVSIGLWVFSLISYFVFL
jgi:hypothetical protein